MTPFEVFLRDIVEHPDDDTLRLIFADWVEEHGDAARGEFIRVQVELARGSSSAQLWRRERELLQENAARWLGAWMKKLHRWLFHRGFLERLECNAAHFLEGDALIEREPLAQLKLLRVNGVLNRLATSALLSRLTALDLAYNFLGDAGVSVLASSAHLGRMRVLRLAHNFLREGAAVALATSPSLKNLHLLDLSGNNLRVADRDILIARFGSAVHF